MSKILVIEDEKKKIDKLNSFLKGHETTFKESFQSGLLELKSNYRAYDMLILDMTIPLWEKGQNDLGGNYEQFGGERILREMKRRKIHIPTVLFTMFDIFPLKGGELTFAELNSLFKKQFQPFYTDAVFYNSDDETWAIDLGIILDNIKKFQ